MIVKICGITSIEDAWAAYEAGAGAIGFNLVEEAKRRKRYVPPEAIPTLMRGLPRSLAIVAVTANEPLDRLRAMLCWADYVQLCGEESPAVCAALEGRAIKVFRINHPLEPEHLDTYRCCAAWLLDAGAPGVFGGTGTVCDWGAAARICALGFPVILAGGLTPDNVSEAVRRVRPFAVDTAGGVERAPGKKDHGKLRSFVHSAKPPLPSPGDAIPIPG